MILKFSSVLSLEMFINMTDCRSILNNRTCWNMINGAPGWRDVSLTACTDTGSGAQLSSHTWNVTPDRPDARSKVNIHRNLVCCVNMAAFILSTSMEQVEKGWGTQGKVEKKKKLPRRCSCLGRQGAKEGRGRLEHLIRSVKAFVSVRCQLRGLLGC